MRKECIDAFILEKKGLFRPLHARLLSKALESTPEDHLILLNKQPYKKTHVALLLSLFLGVLGADRFYLGDYLLGGMKLLLFTQAVGIALDLLIYSSDRVCLSFSLVILTVVCIAWVVTDFFLVMKRAQEKNLELLMPYV